MIGEFGSLFSGRTGRFVMVALLGGALITSVIVGSSGAFFNVFSTGTVDIAGSPASAAVSFGSMAPGDRVTAPLTVSNNGTMQLRYAVRSTTTENLLAAQLDLTVKTGVSACNNAGFAADGTVVYGPGDAGLVAGLNLVGDPAQGAHPGDRTLAASANEVLCVQVSLPASTGNSYQGLTTTATLELLAEQTANNG
jgi:hypothetical protein